MTPFQLFNVMVAMRMHFTQPSYDFVKFKGKTKTSLESFEARRDRMFFFRLEKKNLKDPVTFMAASFSENQDLWVMDFIENFSLAERRYNDWLKRQESLSYLFEQDLTKLPDDLSQCLTVTDNNYPLLFDMVRKKTIMKETVYIMDKLLGFSSYWDKKITSFDDIIYPKLLMNIKKIGLLIEPDVIKYKSSLRNKFISGDK